METGGGDSSSGSQRAVELVLPPLADAHSHAGRRLLESLLCFDPSKRPSAHELLSGHEFLAGSRPQHDSKTLDESSAEARWHALTGCTCDGCGRKMLGLRFYCEICESFDYCQACFVERKLGRNEHEHPFACSREVSEYRWFDTAAQAAAFAGEGVGG